MGEKLVGTSLVEAFTGIGFHQISVTGRRAVKGVVRTILYGGTIELEVAANS